MKKIVIGGIVSLFLLIGCAKKAPVEKPKAFPFPEAPRERLLDFDLPNLEEEYVRVGNLVGKVTIVNFWSTWTTPCTIEVRYLKRLYKKYKPKGLEIVGIGIDYSYKLRDFVRRNRVPYPVLVGNEEIIRLYAPEGVPLTLILDNEGKIAYKDRGFGPKIAKEFEAQINRLLSE